MITAYPFSVTVALTVDTNAYTANDVMGGLLTFAIPGPGNGGFISKIRIIDDDNEKAAVKLFLFNAAPTAIADDAAFAPAVGDLKKMISVVAIAAADYTTINSNAYAIKGDFGNSSQIDFLASDGGNLYAYLVCDATPTYTAAADLTIVLEGWTF